METTAHSQVLKRVGIVLLLEGLLDLAWMVYCVLGRLTSTFKFNVFAIVAAVFLLRGRLRAASVVLWLSAFGVSAMVLTLLMLPFMQPWDLSLTQMRLNPLTVLGGIAFSLVFIGLLARFNNQLGSAPVLAARVAAGRPIRNMRIPAIAGVALSLALGVALSMFVGGEIGRKAESMAAKAQGNGYRYRVSSLNIKTGTSGTSVSGMVTAWNEVEIKQVPVSWIEN